MNETSVDVLGLFDLWPIGVVLGALMAGNLYLEHAVAERKRRQRQERLGTLEQRLERAGKDMTAVRELLNGIEAELSARQAALERLTAETANWKQLAQLHKAEAEAVGVLVRDELERNSRRGLLHTVVSSAVFFVLGVGTQLFLGGS